MWVLSLSLLSNGLCYYSSGCLTCPRHCCYCCWSKHNKAVLQNSSLQPSRLPGLVRCVGSRLRGCRFLEYWATPSLLLGVPTETHLNLANGVCKCLMRTSGVGEGWRTRSELYLKEKETFKSGHSHEFQSRPVGWDRILFLTLVFGQEIRCSLF